MSAIRKLPHGTLNRTVKRGEGAVRVLQGGKECYRLLVENAPLGILTCDTSGNIIAINQKALELIGSVTVDFNRSVNLLSFQPLIDSGISGEITACLSTGEAVAGECHNISSGGKEVFIRYNFSPIRGKNGAIIGAQGIVEDITGLRQAGEALRSSEARFRTLYENTGIAIIMVDTDTGAIIDCNSNAEKLVGRTRDEITRMIVTELHPHDDSEHGSSIRHDARRGHIVKHEAEILHKDGRRIPVIIHATLMDVNGRKVTMGFLIDIAERKRSEVALRQSESQFRALAETTPMAICILQDGRFKYSNPAMEAISGYTKEELSSMDFKSLVHPDAMEYIKLRYGSWLMGVDDEARSELKCIKKSGDVRWIDLSRKTIDYEGKPALLLGGIDITERKTTEEALEWSEEKYRNVVEQSSDCLLLADERGFIVEFNRAGARITGLEPAEWIGRPLWEFIFRLMPSDLKKPEMIGQLEASLQSTCQIGYKPWQDKTLEVKIQRPDGEVRFVQIVTFSFDTTRGIMTGSIARDITDNKRAEVALRESEEKFRVLAETTHAGIALYRDEQFIYVNPVLEELSGYLKEELLQMRFWDLLHPDYRDLVRDRGLARQRGEQMPSRYEAKMVTRTGGVKWLELSAGIINYLGEPTGIVTLYEITERKRAENALRDNEQFLNNVLDSITDGISVIDTDMNIIRVNRTMEKWHPDTLPLVGKKCYSAYHGRSEPCIWCPSLKAIREKAHQINIVPRDVACKTVGWQEVHSYPLQDDAGDVVGVIDYVRDITEHKLAEDALLESEEKFRVLAEASSAMIWLYQGERFIYINSAGERMTGYTIDELMQMRFWEVAHPDDQDMIRDRGLARQRGETVPGKYEVKLLTRGGKTRWAELTAGRILYRGEPAGIATFFDITERKQAEEALASAKAEAELYLDLMGHDINNMNQVTMGFIEMAYNKVALEGKLTADDIYLLEKALESVQNSSNLIRNVRKLQRAKLGMYEPEVLDLGELIRDVVMQHGDVPGRDVVIICNAGNGCLVKANWLLKDVFINLIGNAIKHSKGPLEVNISISEENACGQVCWKVTVEDDGPGIPDSQKKTLFDRLNISVSRVRGKGFGLCLIKLLIEDYRGRFWVEDRVPGDHTQGARFVVVLPAAEH